MVEVDDASSWRRLAEQLARGPVRDARGLEVARVNGVHGGGEEVCDQRRARVSGKGGRRRGKGAGPADRCGSVGWHLIDRRAFDVIVPDATYNPG